MKAFCWHGVRDVRLDSVPDPVILNPGDIIIRTSLVAICGSDLHLYDGCIPAMRKGDIRLPLTHWPFGYEIFRNKQDRCLKGAPALR
jgi:threonine dehydrogenase-like Zn-dependent dehydrogenase